MAKLGAEAKHRITEIDLDPTAASKEVAFPQEQIPALLHGDKIVDRSGRLNKVMTVVAREWSTEGFLHVVVTQKPGRHS